MKICLLLFPFKAILSCHSVTPNLITIRFFQIFVPIDFENLPLIVSFQSYTIMSFSDTKFDHY